MSHWEQCCGKDAWILQILHLIFAQGIFQGSYLLHCSQPFIVCLFLRFFSPSPDLFPSHSPLKSMFSQRTETKQPFTHPEPPKS